MGSNNICLDVHIKDGASLLMMLWCAQTIFTIIVFATIMTEKLGYVLIHIIAIAMQVIAACYVTNGGSNDHVKLAMFTLLMVISTAATFFLVFFITSDLGFIE